MKYLLFRLLSLIRPNERPSDFELISYGYNKCIEHIRNGSLTVFPVACTPDYPAYMPQEQERHTDPTHAIQAWPLPTGEWTRRWHASLPDQDTRHVPAIGKGDDHADH